MRTLLAILLIAGVAAAQEGFDTAGRALSGKPATWTFTDPTSISGLHAWFDPATNAGVATYAFTDAGSTHCYDFNTWGANILVYQWSDRSGNNRHATYGDVQPYFLGKTNPPCLGFWYDNKNQKLSTANFTELTGGFVGFMVARTATLNATWKILLDCGPGDPDHHVDIDWRPTGTSDAGKLGMYAGTWACAPTALSDSTAYVISFRFAGDNSFLRVNGSANATNGPAGSQTAIRWRIGNRFELDYAWFGWIGDTFLYGTTNGIGLTEIQAAEQWLTNKYKVTGYAP